MNDQKDWLETDDSEAIAFIRKNLSPELSSKVNDFQIEAIIEGVYAFYEEKGVFDYDQSEDAFDLDEEELFSFVWDTIDHTIRKELSITELRQIIELELDYSDNSDGF